MGDITQTEKPVFLFPLMEIKDYNKTGVYQHKTNGFVVDVKWLAKKDVDDLREKPYVYEAVVSVGSGKSMKTIRIRETNPKAVHSKVEQEIDRFYSDHKN